MLRQQTTSKLTRIIVELVLNSSLDSISRSFDVVVVVAAFYFPKKNILFCPESVEHMGKLYKILFFKSTSIFSLFLSFKLFLTHISILCKRQNCTYILCTQSSSAQICKNMTVKSVQEMCCYFSLYTSFPTVSKTDILFSYYNIISTENERKCFDFLFGLQSYWLLISVFTLMMNILFQNNKKVLWTFLKIYWL